MVSILSRTHEFFSLNNPTSLQLVKRRIKNKKIKILLLYRIENVGLFLMIKKKLIIIK